MFITTEIENDFGIDVLDITVKLWPLIHAERNIGSELNRFKSYLVSQIKRGITKDEENRLLHCILDYAMSDAGTPERFEAMQNLFGLKFLDK